MRVQPIQIFQQSQFLEKPKDLSLFTPKEPQKETYKQVPLDTLQAYSNVSFDGYTSEIKRLYKRGRLEIKYSFYGGLLDPKQFSTDHIIPISKGGKSQQSNYVFCNAWQNSVRSNYPLEDFIDWESVGMYFEQFRGVRVDGFNGDEYIKQILNSINEAIKSGR